MPNSQLPNPSPSTVSPETQQPTSFEDENRGKLAKKPLSFLAHRRFLILGCLLLAAGAGWGGYWWLTGRGGQNSLASVGPASQSQPIPVKLTTVQTTLVADSSEVVGTLEAQRSVNLKPEINGRVVAILVKEGDRVRQGQPIIRLDSDDLEAESLEARAKLENAKAKLAELQAGSRDEDIDEARARLKEEQSRLSNAQAGARPQEIAQAQAQLEAAQARSELAQQRVDRYRQLQKEGAISEDQFQEYLTEARSSSASVQQAQRRLDELRKSRRSDLDGLEAAVEQARQNLRRLENGPRRETIAQAKADVAEAAAQVRMAAVKVKKTQVGAPIAGIIGDIPLKLGDYVEEGESLTTITENNRLEVNLSIPLEKNSDLRLGLPVEVLDSQDQVLGRGEITFISPDVSADSQMLLAKATLNDFQGKLLNRQLVETRIIWDKNPGILLPAAAISRVGGQTFVFVAESDSSGQTEGGNFPLVARQRVVKLGNLQGNDYHIIEGLQPGEKVVSAGILNLTDGAPIQPLAEAN